MYADVIIRATLCVSAVFAVVRCPSVCPSDMLADCIHTAEDIVKLLVPPGSTTSLGFWPQTPIPNSKAKPISCGEEYKTVIVVYIGNGAIIGSRLLWNVNMKTCMGGGSIRQP